jgi:hypothetical protein
MSKVFKLKSFELCCCPRRAWIQGSLDFLLCMAFKASHSSSPGRITCIYLQLRSSHSSTCQGVLSTCFVSCFMAASLALIRRCWVCLISLIGSDIYSIILFELDICKVEALTHYVAQAALKFKVFLLPFLTSAGITVVWHHTCLRSSFYLGHFTDISNVLTSRLMLIYNKGSI